jgi:hypothetical protein
MPSISMSLQPKQCRHAGFAHSAIKSAPVTRRTEPPLPWCLPALAGRLGLLITIASRVRPLARMPEHLARSRQSTQTPHLAQR